MVTPSELQSEEFSGHSLHQKLWLTLVFQLRLQSRLLNGRRFSLVTSWLLQPQLTELKISLPSYNGSYQLVQLQRALLTYSSVQQLLCNDHSIKFQRVRLTCIARPQSQHMLLSCQR